MTAICEEMHYARMSNSTEKQMLKTKKQKQVARLLLGMSQSYSVVRNSHTDSMLMMAI